MATFRVLRTSATTLSKALYLDEVAGPATGNVVVTVRRLDGTTVQTGNATGPTNGNVYSFVFSGSDTLDNLSVTWAYTISGDAQTLDQDEIEVVGGLFFSIAEGRAADAQLSNTQKYPTADLIERRIQAEDECERITGQAWVPRFARATLSGDSTGRLRVPHTMIRSVRAITVNGSVWSPGQISGIGFSDTGMLYVDGSYFAPSRNLGSKNITVEYEHGNDRPEPEIVRAAKLRFKSLAMESRSALPDRAERVIAIDQAGGTTVYGQPTVEKTGIPAVDAVYARYPSPRPGFG